MQEIWRDVKGYEGIYQVSNKGNIKSLDREKINHNKVKTVKGKIKAVRNSNTGYLIVDLYKNGKQSTLKVHRIVAQAFIDNSQQKPTVNHIDGNKHNNCVKNLEWCSFREQNIHFYKNNLKSNENINKSIKAMNEANAKKVLCVNTGIVYNSIADAGRAFNVSGSFITRCCKGKAKTAKGCKWAYV